MAAVSALKAWQLVRSWGGIRSPRVIGQHIGGRGLGPSNAVVTIDMADAAHALVQAPIPAASAQTQLTGNIACVDPNSGQATEDLTLPAVADSTGLWILILNTGGEGIVVKAVGGATIITLDTAQHGIVACDGTTWRGFIGGVT